MTDTLTFGDRINLSLMKNKRTKRWLISELKNNGLNFTDTQLSNRVHGIIPFSDEEIKTIEKTLKKHKIEY